MLARMYNVFISWTSSHGLYAMQDNISAKIGLILSFSLILVWGARVPVVRIGRIAGQYAKPRSSSYERVGDREVLSFRGDNVNGLDINDRTPDPERLLR
ncbi:hypothetical protein H0H93_001251, partial [Arthromyces matolae]